jgi:hypothetical protein
VFGGPLKRVKRSLLALLDAQTVQSFNYVNIPRYYGELLDANSILKHENGVEQNGGIICMNSSQIRLGYSNTSIKYRRIELHGNVPKQLLSFLELWTFLRGRVLSFEFWCCIEVY